MKKKWKKTHSLKFSHIFSRSHIFVVVIAFYSIKICCVDCEVGGGWMDMMRIVTIWVNIWYIIYSIIEQQPKIEGVGGLVYTGICYGIQWSFAFFFCIYLGFFVCVFSLVVCVVVVDYYLILLFFWIFFLFISTCMIFILFVSRVEYIFWIFQFSVWRGFEWKEKQKILCLFPLIIQFMIISFSGYIIVCYSYFFM